MFDDIFLRDTFAALKAYEKERERKAYRYLEFDLSSLGSVQMGWMH